MKIVTPCNPGYGASCVLCCGSHNYRASFERIDAMFRDRSAMLVNFNREYIIDKIRASRSNLTGSYYFTHEKEYSRSLPEPIVIGGVQCPFVGYIGTSRIGCIINGAVDDYSRCECFYKYNGKHFCCNASLYLRNEEIYFAAKLMSDWYFYSLLIHSPDILQSNMLRNNDPGKISHSFIINIKEQLLERLYTDKSLHPNCEYFS